ncbi:hypothetical protein ZIOFF_038919 [Zingiber officinale]|uniref:WAT1-related protein n=1 Tax=Zingiber officinale TaxID=94328 RepID=A0A8J5KT17_ZINOF|nr:hypothetical protein ZIOFF_038919 [Zingiber officinale]
MLEDDLRIPELVRRWKDLEHLEMEIVGIFAPPILSSSRSCNLSFAIPISLPKPLSFATSSLPRLHSPPSRNPGPFRAQVSVSAAQKTKDRLPANLIVTETKGPHSTIRLNVEVPPAISQECYGEVLDEFSKKAKVPSFRQGKKVPENILLNYIGRQNIQQAVVEATLKKTLPHAMSSFAYAGSSILGKLALGQGLSALVFVVYRHLIAMLILAPLAYVLERNRRPSFSFGVMLKIFILAMLGITIQQNVYYVGLHLISPTVASALGNVIPAFTFLLAIVLRMEKLNLKTCITCSSVTAGGIAVETRDGAIRIDPITCLCRRSIAVVGICSPRNVDLVIHYGGNRTRTERRQGKEVTIPSCGKSSSSSQGITGTRYSGDQRPSS